MSKIVFRMRLPSPNLVVEVDQETSGVVIHPCSTAYAARDQDQSLGGTGRVIELSELVSRAFKGRDGGKGSGQSKKSES
jgi:hypothetical protein